ncbi:MAG: DUF3868 domain-containing protein [Parabacteroides sp.]|nr:DUF3868 domain-containing protein [Parabacteroides sp.]
MKLFFLLLLYIYAGSFCCVFSQTKGMENAFKITQKKVSRHDDKLCLSMDIDVSEMTLSSNHSLLCSLILEAGDSIQILPSIRFNGRSRHLLYRRATDDIFVEPNVYRRYNEKDQFIHYFVEVPFYGWMDNAELSVVFDECGCGWKELQKNKAKLFTINIPQSFVLSPVVLFSLPQMDDTKHRKLEGKAFLDFPVNEIKIYPDYRKNPEELAKIRRTIDEVRHNKYATITAIRIKGYASPEGSYKNNAYLAEYRAKALSAYVKELYDLEAVAMYVDFEPEDWKGLENALESGVLTDKEQLLAIVRADEPKDWDQREWKLKTLNGGKSYPYLLKEIYPALRHSDYEVDYTIRNLTLDEARVLAFTDPKQLSLGEFLRVAESFNDEPEKQAEVIRMAVLLYPAESVANLNAAVLAIREKDVAKAKRYLSRTDSSPEKALVEAAIAMQESDWKTAELYLKQAAQKPELQKAVEENRKQCELKQKTEL